MADDRKLWLVDGSSYLYRAVHALPPFSSSRGGPPGAVLGVLRVLMNQQTEAARAEQARLAQVHESVSSRLTVWRQQPGFTEHEADLRPVQAQLVQQGMDPWNALGLAYAQVVVPKLRASHTNHLVAEAARKAAGTTDNPSTVTPTPPTRARTFAEALERAAGAR